MVIFQIVNKAMLACSPVYSVRKGLIDAQTKCDCNLKNQPSSTDYLQILFQINPSFEICLITYSARKSLLL